ncbi:DUF1697 domain-containing protein [Paracoccus methylarcula]|uniref:DUF1697 domain-containing protein n=2 Tax=Paracoccus methylarcula TaxID=72022 RepID=A0A422QZM7_9RHOB|nr:DUF1697 domain-containing protein [Paracoccus methylarcula]
MAIFVALLRAVNVGGTGKLPMADLRAICEEIGFEGVRTYIQSGNVVFRTSWTSEAAKSELEARLHERMGKPVGVIMRDPHSLHEILARNPFPKAAPNQIGVLFLDQATPSDVLDTAKRRTDEEIQLGDREIFIHYPSGMGRSRLHLSAMELGTVRNLNTVAKLTEISADGA